MKNIGIVGCGDISGTYLKNLTTMFSDRLQITGICDLIREKAERRANEYNISKIYKDMWEIFNDSEVDIVLNLTRPYEHFEVTMAALNAGKHVYTEKPIGATLDEGRKITKLAKKKNLLVGGAPDTFLGAGIQTCRQLIADGVVGDIIGASAYFVCRGHESWHPDPEFYYRRGGGPMLDMGPYYVTSLVNLVGSIKSVTGTAKMSFPTRTFTCDAKYGEIIGVDVPTHYNGIMEFENGAVGTIMMTFDVFTAEVPRIEIYGSKGTLSVPDPNYFEGPVRFFDTEKGEFVEMPLVPGLTENSRGLGLCNMIEHLETGVPFLANNDLLIHVLEVMCSFEESCKKRSFIDIETRVRE